MTAEEGGCCSCVANLRGSRSLVLLIVAIALLLDNMLLTAVVPIIPSFLYHIRHRPVGTITIPAQVIPKKIQQIRVPNMPLNEDNVPYFLPQLRDSEKANKEDHKSSDWELSGITIVPNDVFWEFTASAVSVRELGVTNDKVARKSRHDELMDENFEVGLMFASKPFVQAIVNPFVGPISNRIGYPAIMFIGFLTLVATSLAFAIGNTYSTLFMARALQGVGSSCTSVGGMGMLAEIYPDDKERGNAMGLALGGLALGVLIGPVFGGALYDFVGKATPFLILAGLAFVDGGLQLFVLRPRVNKKKEEGPSILTLIKDPYIMVAAGAITFSNIGIAVLEPSLPLWMMDTMNASKWQQGIAFLPASISYLIGTNLFGPLGHKIGRWLSAMIGLLIIGVCLICVPFAKSVEELIAPNAGIGFAIGMVDSSMMPLLGYLTDIRHTSVYGCVYAIADVAFCFGFIIGPIISATVVQRFGFEGSVCAVATCSFLYAPLMLFLRKPLLKADMEMTKSPTEKYMFQPEDEDEDGTEIRKPLKEEPTCY